MRLAEKFDWKGLRTVLDNMKLNAKSGVIIQTTVF
jgi:hypothetical protein